MWPWRCLTLSLWLGLLSPCREPTRMFIRNGLRRLSPMTFPGMHPLPVFPVPPRSTQCAVCRSWSPGSSHCRNTACSLLRRGRKNVGVTGGESEEKDNTSFRCSEGGTSCPRAVVNTARESEMVHAGEIGPLRAEGRSRQKTLKRLAWASLSFPKPFSEMSAPRWDRGQRHIHIHAS